MKQYNTFMSSDFIVSGSLEQNIFLLIDFISKFFKTNLFILVKCHF